MNQSINPQKLRDMGIERPDAAGLAISLTGGVFLSFQGRACTVSSLRARGLLGVLALSEAGTATREYLAGLLWPDKAEAASRASLRQVLLETQTALRAAGAPPLSAGRNQIGLPRCRISVDILEAAADAERGAVAALLLARPRVTASLLAGHEDISAEFAQFVLEARAGMAARLMQSLAAGSADESAPLPARLNLARAACLLDPADEPSARALMRLCASAHDNGGAMRAYEALCRVLRDDLDTPPSPETAALADSIKGAGRQQAPMPAILRGIALPRVTILPFRCLGPDPVAAYSAECLAEDIAATLASLREPVVVANGAEPIGAPAEGSYFIEGSIRGAGGQALAAVQLVEAASSTVLWARRFGLTPASGIGDQGGLGARIANALAPHIHFAELRRFPAGHLPGASAYAMMLSARQLAGGGDRASFLKAGALLRAAAALSPSQPGIHYALATWHTYRISQGWSGNPAPDVEATRHACQVAIGLDPGHAPAIALLGHNTALYRQDCASGLALTDRALKAAPYHPAALLWASPALSMIGEGREAVCRAEQALALAPDDPMLFRTYHFLAIGHYMDGQIDAAAHFALLSDAANPHYASNLRLTAAVLVADGRRQEAAALSSRHRSLAPSINSADACMTGHAKYPLRWRNAPRQLQFCESLREAGFLG
jgi:DNA-binding SARP family transcriptional activator